MIAGRGWGGVYLLLRGCFAPILRTFVRKRINFIKEKRFQRLNHRKGCKRVELKSDEYLSKASIKRNDIVVLLFVSRCG